jgi:Rhodopirellula transposase DDE domain
MTNKTHYDILRSVLNEKQWRIYLGTEAEKIGRGGVSRVSRESGSSRNTVQRWINDAKDTVLLQDKRVRKIGWWRKRIQTTDTTLIADIESLIEPKWDPMSLVRWTTKSLNHLVDALALKNHTIKKSALAHILERDGFSLKANKKNIEGISHPDRDLQFQHIKKTCALFEQNGNPIISVDCKKKELIGNFKNGWREWQAQGKTTTVNVYDFKNIADGKACPYGIYDTLRNTGFVNVGTDHDTASFAVESVRKWWNTTGRACYSHAKKLLITSDGGWSNWVRNRLWKKELQILADETGLTITVAHLPPATSKWNKIEHRLFSYISVNWRGVPLTSLETIIELISHTTTEKGLSVQAVIDHNVYPIGVKVSDADMATLNITRNEFHGDWNYTIAPRKV